MTKIERLNTNGNLLGTIKSLYEQENKTVTEIALIFGVDRHDISKWCKSNGYTFKVKTIDNWAKENNILDIHDWLYNQYIEKCFSCSDIANKIGVSTNAVCNKMKLLGIKVRNTKQASNNYWSSMDEFELQEYKNKITKPLMDYRSNETELMRLERSKKQSEGQLRYWANAGEEAHKKLSESTSRGAIKRLSNWSDEQKRSCLDRLQKGHIKHYASLTPEQKRQSIAKAEKIFRDKYNSDPEYKAECIRKSLAAQNFRESKPEKAIKQSLVDHGYGDFVDQYQMGYYSIDIAYPQYKLAIEVDGEYWHSLPKVANKDKSKNSYIQNYCKWNLLRLPATPCLKQTEQIVWDIIEHIETIKLEMAYEQ